ncbi:MAG: RNA-binding transcriptional accessory protein [Candidatus Riflebacteria bacterium GWC2_50_8]|nr:MAG: RNA-binding transcriptional accessory protein [Candidatus Riflebacteria bacterium GWC2_50_8]
MNDNWFARIADELKVNSLQVMATAQLLDEGGTVPFISRYRKERTGSLDEVQIQTIRDRLEQFAEFDKRREAIVKSLTERSLLTDELTAKIDKAANISELEDVYLPYRQKKRTRATIAREKGLEDLAQMLLKQAVDLNPAAVAVSFIAAEKGVESVEDALQGARDIIAEMVSENAEVRVSLRELFAAEAFLVSKVVKDKETEGAKFRDYFDWQEPAAKIAGHRLLAILRGENEGFLKVSLQPDSEKASRSLTRFYRQAFCPAWEQVREAIEDSYKRLLSSSIENEFRKQLRERAEEEAIRVFAANLRELLMAPPLGQKSVLAVDPGFRTGCKVVCLDPQGKLLEHEVIFISQSEQARVASALMIKKLVDRHKIEAVAIGNGTGSRETEAFIKSLQLPSNIAVVMVNESGASIYSASEVAREEFPTQDLTVRGAVSIGRRLMDPLAELVKIDAKSIGVGQYQHDVEQGKLKKGLDDVVMSCVNGVGVEVNTASRQILSYVAGLGPQLAKNIVSWREENGAFKNRRQLNKVPRLGPRAFEQAAGFLRVRNSDNPLDNSAVHPESYKIVEKMAKDLDCSVADLIKSQELRNRIKLKDYITEETGLPTLSDIMKELSRPGLDPRDKFEAFAFAEGINEIKDLSPGMILPGIVTNVTQFGAFVDIGVHQDGLVHVSQLSDRFVKDPGEVVKVQQKVLVRVLEVDAVRRRISLSMKSEKKAAEKW